MIDKRVDNFLKDLDSKKGYGEAGKRLKSCLDTTFSTSQGLESLRYISSLCLTRNTHLLSEEQKKEAIVLRSFYDRLTAFIDKEILIRVQYGK